jgi:hypothetical protein
MLNILINKKDELVQNLKQKFDDLFLRHGSALNLIDELTEKNKFLEINCRRESNLSPANSTNLINLNCLMNSEKEILADDYTKKEKDNKQENYTINMKVNFKNLNKNSIPFINLNSRRGLTNQLKNFNEKYYSKNDDILTISEEIYQKRLSKVN